MLVVPLDGDYRSWVREVSDDLFGGEVVISRGLAHRPHALPGFVAVDEAPIGLATYRVHGSECELVTLNALNRWRGIGTRLIQAVEEQARQGGCRRLWLITTNDNLEAVRFYQRRGFRLSALYPGALEVSRKLKPTIPAAGNFGIPLRDELELEKPLS
ncbi:MAG: GNAT family N-acetyltransferase [Armatimonadetes bacterium]|nr:GNAT family N-acetyltransferase [Armatimonadota bacterium]